MRKIISGLLIGLLFMGCTKQETTYTIQGEWEGGDGKVVYLKKDLGDKNMRYWIPLSWQTVVLKCKSRLETWMSGFWK